MQEISTVNHLEPVLQADIGEEVRNVQSEVQRLQAEFGQLKAKLAAVITGLTEAQGTIRAINAELAECRKVTTTLRKELVRSRRIAVAIPSSISPTALLPDDGNETTETDWFEQWQKSRGFASEKAAVWAMGSQGLCLRDSIGRTLDQEGLFSATTMGRSLERLRDRGLITKAIPRVESKGRASHLYYLTDKGREAFRLLFGEEAVESEYHRLKARHGSDEHVLLNLQAREVFVARGAAVDLYPQPIAIEGSTFTPDLVVTFPEMDRPLYVECERIVPKQRRDTKWQSYAAVTQDFYLVVPNTRVQSQILSEITGWILRTGHSIAVHICNLSTLTASQTLPWTVEEQIAWGRYQ